MNSERASSPISSRGVLSIAFGDPSYLAMAKALGRSLKLHAPLLATAIVTDACDSEIRQLYTHVIPFRPEYGSDVRQKLYLARYSPFAETLFLDSDSLVLNDLESFWQAFAGKYFGVPGWRVLRKGDRDPYLDVDFILDHFALDRLPKFNGGAYYFARSVQTSQFFSTVEYLLSNYKALRFPEFRHDSPNDEAIFSVAMALHGLSSTSMGHRGMWTPISSRGPLALDVLHGTCHFEKEGVQVSPDVIHFAGGYSSCFEYLRERERLRVHLEGGRLSLNEWSKMFLRSACWSGLRGSKTLLKRLVRQDAARRITRESAA